MAQSVQITFPNQYYAEGKYVQFIMTLDYNNYTSIVPYNASYYNLIIEQYGNVELKFNIDDYLLVPSSFSIQIGDMDNNLEDLLFHNEANAKLEVTGKLYINGSLEFEGKHIPESLKYSSNRVIGIDFKSNTDILNETYLTDSAGSSKNPLSLGTGLANTSSYKTAIHNAYKLINSSIELVVNHNWLYYGDTHYVSGTNYQISDGTFDELYTDSDQFYYGSTLADTLKEQAKRKFAFTGCINNSKAFFTRLYYYSSSNLQTLTVKKYTRGYGLPNLTYVASKTVSPGNIIHELPDADAYNAIMGKSLELNLAIEPDENYDGWIYRGGKYYYIEKINDPLLDSSFYYVGFLLPTLHYNYRGKQIYNILDSFTIDGLDVDYLKNFNYDGRKYQILNMAKQITTGTTIIDALYLGSV